MRCFELRRIKETLPLSSNRAYAAIQIRLHREIGFRKARFVSRRQRVPSLNEGHERTVALGECAHDHLQSQRKARNPSTGSK